MAHGEKTKSKCFIIGYGDGVLLLLFFFGENNTQKNTQNNTQNITIYSVKTRLACGFLVILQLQQ